MPVIINEFEVIAEPPTPPAASSESESSSGHALTPEDIEQIMKYFRERQERVHAD